MPRQTSSGGYAVRSGKALIFVATLDDLATVAEHQTAARQKPRLDGDRVVGPGTNTSTTTASLIAAADALLKSGLRPEHDLVFAAVAQEETGLKGMLALYAQWKDSRARLRRHPRRRPQHHLRRDHDSLVEGRGERAARPHAERRRTQRQQGRGSRAGRAGRIASSSCRSRSATRISAPSSTSPCCRAVRCSITSPTPLVLARRAIARRRASGGDGTRRPSDPRQGHAETTITFAMEPNQLTPGGRFRACAMPRSSPRRRRSRSISATTRSWATPGRRT